MRGNKVQRRGDCNESFFQFYTFLATGFPLRSRLVGQREEQRYVPVRVMALAALFVCLFELRNVFVVFCPFCRALFAGGIFYSIYLYIQAFRFLFGSPFSYVPISA